MANCVEPTLAHKAQSYCVGRWEHLLNGDRLLGGSWHLVMERTKLWFRIVLWSALNSISPMPSGAFWNSPPPDLCREITVMASSIPDVWPRSWHKHWDKTIWRGRLMCCCDHDHLCWHVLLKPIYWTVSKANFLEDSVGMVLANPAKIKVHLLIESMHSPYYSYCLHPACHELH